MNIQPDYYSTLCLNRNAGDNEVKNSFRKLALKYHPERNREKDAPQKFTMIAEAYSVLSNRII
jgi:molecular chaperone DnaJ